MYSTSANFREKHSKGYYFGIVLIIIAMLCSPMIYSQSCYCFTQTHLDYRKIHDFPQSNGNNTQFVSNVFRGDFYASSPKKNSVALQLHDVFQNLYAEKSSWINTFKSSLACYKTENEALKKHRSRVGSTKSDGWTVIDFTFRYIPD